MPNRSSSVVRTLVVCSVLVLGAACRGGGGERDAGTRPGRDAGASGDAARPDAGPAAEANIREVLDCGDPVPVGGMATPGELELHQIDTAEFPDALCNDGTAAVLYYRPYRGEANRNKWAITLRGGGACQDAETCAARWCSCSATDARPCEFTELRTNFTLDNMSGGGRRGNPGGGIHRRAAGVDNPIADFNHVQLMYCSSDEWTGRLRGLPLTTTHPRTGEEVTYVAHFLGALILEADLATLRQDGVPALVYTLDGGRQAMPDLDEAETVLLAGDSAGGTGVIMQLDAVAERLRETHVGGAGPEIRGLIDAVVGPSLERLDWSGFVGAASGIDTYEEAMRSMSGQVTSANQALDQSCVAYHARMGNTELCFDKTHVLYNHLTTPFFVRMALFDSLISRTYSDLQLADPDLGPFESVPVDGLPVEVPLNFATVLARELTRLPTLQTSAEERDAIDVAPGAFGPACFDHDTIHVDEEVYDTTIVDPMAPAGSSPRSLFDVLGPWLAGGPGRALVTTDPMRRDTVCGSR
jgi:hypothetical protein